MQNQLFINYIIFIYRPNPSWVNITTYSVRYVDIKTFDQVWDLQLQIKTNTQESTRYRSVMIWPNEVVQNNCSVSIDLPSQLPNIETMISIPHLDLCNKYKRYRNKSIRKIKSVLSQFFLYLLIFPSGVNLWL